jgi:hypothetical protein
MFKDIGLGGSTLVSPLSVTQGCETPHGSTDLQHPRRGSYQAPQAASFWLCGPVNRSVAGQWLQTDDAGNVWVIS